MDCPACEGGGCPVCRGSGWIEVTACPLTVLPPEVWEVLDLAETFRRGLPPVAGGVLDQSAWFVAAARFVWAEQDRWRAALKLLPFMM